MTPWTTMALDVAAYAFAATFAIVLVVVELGAGRAVPTIRWHSERLGALPGATLIRVNPREPEVSPPHVSIATGAREALERIDDAL